MDRVSTVRCFGGVERSVRISEGICMGKKAAENDGHDRRKQRAFRHLTVIFYKVI